MEEEEEEREAAEGGKVTNGENEGAEGKGQGRVEGDEKFRASSFSLFPARGPSFRTPKCSPASLFPVGFLTKRILWQEGGEADKGEGVALREGRGGPGEGAIVRSGRAPAEEGEENDEMETGTEEEWRGETE